MTDEEIKLCREIGEMIQIKVFEFYRSKRSIESTRIPHDDIKEFLNRYSIDYMRLAQLHQLENAILQHGMFK